MSGNIPKKGKKLNVEDAEVNKTGSILDIDFNAAKPIGLFEELDESETETETA